MSMTRMTNNELIDELIDELDGIIAILETMNAEDCAAAIEELRAVADLVECAPARTLTAAELAEFAELAAAAKARAAAAEEARLKAAGLARLQVAADRFAANKTKAVGGFIDSLASCNTTSILLVGGGLFAIFCTILFTIASQRSI